MWCSVKNINTHTHLNNTTDSSRNQHQQTCVLLQQVEEHDGLGDSTPRHIGGGQAGHGLPPSPKCNVVLEGEEIKEHLCEREGEGEVIVVVVKEEV